MRGRGGSKSYRGGGGTKEINVVESKLPGTPILLLLEGRDFGNLSQDYEGSKCIQM